MHSGGSAERPATFFDDEEEFRAWLETNHASAKELWMGLYKKHVEPRGLTWEAAVREALCFGWIDSQVQRIDDRAVRQRWTPRRPGSVWSRTNIDAVQQLMRQGLMHPAGLAAFERRRADRSAIYTYEVGELAWHDAYEEQLRANPVASAFWDGATASYRKICTNWVLSAKQEATRDRRMAELVDDCANLRLIKTQRYGTEPTWVARLRSELG
jgi:uncharacterized protein YdeI (YjbR/CyaY-like superfamily)